MAAAEAFRNMVQTRDAKGPHQHDTHKDKLAETKQRERELKEAHKAEQRAQKEAREAERHQEAALLKEERMTHDSKRAAKDKRDMAKKEHKAETGEMCEHGVWRCKICFPHKVGKPRE